MLDHSSACSWGWQAPTASAIASASPASSMPMSLGWNSACRGSAREDQEKHQCAVWVGCQSTLLAEAAGRSTGRQVPAGDDMIAASKRKLAETVRSAGQQADTWSRLPSRLLCKPHPRPAVTLPRAGCALLLASQLWQPLVGLRPATQHAKTPRNSRSTAGGGATIMRHSTNHVRCIVAAPLGS